MKHGNVKNLLILGLAFALAPFLIYLSRRFEYFLEIPIMLVPMYFMVKYRREIASLFLNITAPTVFVYLLASLPFLLFEENINCIPYGCRAIPETMPILLVFMLMLSFGVWVFRAKNFKLVIWIFVLIGTIWELLFGHGGVLFSALSLWWQVFILVWVALSYAFVAIIPVTYQILKREKNVSI